jgi:pimeloyl-ACP methyl ester carboxylesterase
VVTYVLIHGAWHGAWCWRAVARALRGASHDVHAPSLTGLGDRRHLSRPDVGLETHVLDVVNLMEMEDLEDVVLVGHSYGGMVVTGAADRVPGRIRSLVYLDAFVPEDGRAALDYVVPERAAAMVEEGRRTGFVSPPPMALWGLHGPEHLRFVGPREMKQPFASLAEPIALVNQPALERLPRTFIYCSSPATGTFDQFAVRYGRAPGWRFHELRSGHDAMILAPDRVSAILLREGSDGPRRAAHGG